MNEVASMRHILGRMAVIILPSGLCAFSGIAQNTISERLDLVLRTQDRESGIKLYNEITEADLAQLPDSVLFD